MKHSGFINCTVAQGSSWSHCTIVSILKFVKILQYGGRSFVIKIVQLVKLLWPQRPSILTILTMRVHTSRILVVINQNRMIV